MLADWAIRIRAVTGKILNDFLLDDNCHLILIGALNEKIEFPFSTLSLLNYLSLVKICQASLQDGWVNDLFEVA